MMNDLQERERLLRILAFATFVIFFQAYMVAPIVPFFSKLFGARLQTVGLIVPAYLVPYGVSTLFYGPLADRSGLRRVMLTSLTAFSLLSTLTALSGSISQLTFWRLLTGFGAGGVVPIALALVGSLYPYAERGRPLGWLFSAMAGGMAFGSPLGVLLIPLVGWRGLFLIVGAAGLLVLALVARYVPRPVVSSSVASSKVSVGESFDGYKSLLKSSRGLRTYGYVFINSMFHSGLFTWISVYFVQRFHLGPVGIGLALLGYGVPGFLFGPLIGRAADRIGRSRLLPVGLLLSASSAAVLIVGFPVSLAPLVMMALSLGYDMTQPLLGGIVTSLAGNRPGQAMGLNVFILFVGFGLGSLIFGELMRSGFDVALAAFGAVECVAAVLSIRLFRFEKPLAVVTNSASP
jgi:predicted MFS family arabinose efflux permease